MAVGEKAVKFPEKHLLRLANCRMTTILISEPAFNEILSSNTFSLSWQQCVIAKNI